MEESFSLISEIIHFKNNELLSCNIYFEGYVENDDQKKKADNLKGEILKNLTKNKVEVNSFRIDLYKKK